MTRTRIVWEDGFDSLPACDWLFVAAPGVGNVGKLVAQSMVETHSGILVARIVHPDLPPHATLDSDGLLRPPSLDIHSVELAHGPVLTLTSNFQPLSPAGQYEVATSVIELSVSSEVGRIMVLAGLSAEPGDDAVHVVCPSEADREAMIELGITVSGEHPSAGIIGLTGMIASLTPTLGQSAVCAVAETVGTSVDVLAADRLARWIDDSFDLGLNLQLDTTEEIAEKLKQFFGNDEVAELDLNLGDGVEGDSEAFYA